jgi:hypothetical protein
MVLGDFNLIRSPENRNKPGGDISEMFKFNSVISALGLNEVNLMGRKFTWSNMQPQPLLEKIDWIFISNCWLNNFPITTAKALDMIPSHHCPCVVSISSSIPKVKIFRFENYWLENPDFLNILAQSWNSGPAIPDSAMNLNAKFKRLRKILRQWKASMTSLK